MSLQNLMQKEEWNDIHHSSNHDYLWPKLFVNRENMQDSEEKGHETEAVGNTGGADCLRAEPKNGRQNKEADCQHVHLIPAVTPIFLLFLQKFLPKGNPCELFVCFYL